MISSESYDKEGISHNVQTHSLSVSIPHLDIKSLSAIIKEARTSRGLTQREFAQKLDITQAQLCRLENSHQPHPTKKTLLALRPYVNLSYSQLLVAAGYKDIVTPDQEYSGLSNEVIDPTKIINDIFRTDPSFLEYLKDFSQYGTPENVNVLKLLIQTMRDAEMEVETPKNRGMKKRFQYLKEYIVGILSISETA